MVTRLAASAAHTGLALRRRTTKNTSTANGTATNASRNIAGAGASRSTKSGSSGVSRPLTTPPTAIFRNSLREVSAVIASVNVHLVMPRPWSGRRESMGEGAAPQRSLRTSLRKLTRAIADTAITVISAAVGSGVATAITAIVTTITGAVTRAIAVAIAVTVAIAATVAVAIT